MTKSILKIATVVAALTMSVAAMAQKPQWVGNTPKELNDTYKFVEITTTASSLELARTRAKEMLADDTQLQEGVRVYRKSTKNTDIDRQSTNGAGLQETIREKVKVEMTVDGEKFDLQAVRVDEYVREAPGGVELHALYMVALCENPVFDRTYLTTNYGVAPALMSVIPGLGQWYKGSKAKAAVLFGATAAGVAGVILCENQRASFEKKITEQPRKAKDYSNKMDNWETGRNICIGVAAAVWVYNIVDAAVAKGARRVAVERADSPHLSVAPMVAPSDGGAGLTLALNF